MGFFELLLIAVSMSMDAFAVSICKGLSVCRVEKKHALSVGLWFGGFQGMMPVIGFALTALFAGYIEAVSSYIAFVLLLFIGGNMIRESMEKEEDGCDDSFAWKAMLPLAVATSIDALAVGISLAMAGNVHIWLAALLIGICTCGFSAAGVQIGNLFGARFEKKAQLAGGLILVLLGLKILLEHLGVIA